MTAIEVREQGGKRGALVDDGQAANGAVDGAALGDAHANQTARHIARPHRSLTVQRQRAVPIARAVNRTLQHSPMSFSTTRTTAG